MATTIKLLNAEIKKRFGKHPSFVPAKASFAGSIPAIRFEADLPVSLACEIADFVEREWPNFACNGRLHRVVGFLAGGTVINWY